MNIEIGLQLYSVRNELQRDYLKTLENIAAIGYKNLELISKVTDDGLQFSEDLHPGELRRQLDRLGLKAVSCHVMPVEGMNWDKVIDTCVEIGVEAMVVPFAVFDDRQGVVSFCQGLNQAAELCRKQAVQLYYHNHFQEFQKFDGQLAMDIMLEQLDSDLVMFEFDSYWAIRGGQDPLAWLRKLGKRCDLLHQKDLPPGVQPVNLFDLAVQNPAVTMWDMFKVISKEQFAEIGTGVIPIADILEAGCTYGNARYVFVEQDMTSLGEMESVALSYQNLSRLVHGT